MKKFILLLCSLFVVGSLSFASPAALNFSNLSEERLPMDQYLMFINYYEVLKYPGMQIDEEFEKVLVNTEKFNESLKKLKKPNYDESLLRLIVLRCLYNYDRVTAKDVEDFYNALNKKYKNKAEHHWVYGNYLGTTFSNLKAMKEMQTYMEMVDYSVNPFFMSDMAYISLLSGCPISALDELTIGGQIPPEEMVYPNLYATIMDQIKTANPKKTYSGEEIWKMGCRLSNPDELRLYSTMLGVSLPVTSDWTIKTYGYSNDVAIVLLTPPAFKVKKEEVSIQILVTLTRKTAANKNSNEKVINGLTNPVLLDEKPEVRSLIFDVYKAENPEVYNDDVRKGSVNYVYVGTTDHQDNNGYSVEYPIDMEKMNSGLNDNNTTSYFHQSPAYLRFDDEFDVVIFVDSCKAVEKQTQELMKEFLSHVIFE